jgi:glycosyltransferase involved in cell wall biosynthesis
MQPRTGDDARRVLYYNHVGELSGAEASLLTLVSNLAPDRFEPHVVAPLAGSFASALARQRIPCHPIPAIRVRQTGNPLSTASSLMRLLTRRIQVGGVVQQVRPRLLHANSLTAGTIATTWSLGMPPVVLHVRDLQFPRRAMQWAASGAEAIIAISECVKEAVVAAIPEAATRIRVIYNGIDPTHFRPQRPREQIRDMLGIGEGELLIGSVGQLVPWKRQDRFLEAAALITAQVPHCRFIIVGADMFGEHSDYVAALRAQASRLGLARPVIWGGYRDDVADLMAAMDIMVHTAENEPLGRVILEALCVGTPCVAVDTAGPKEIIRNLESGMLTKPDARSLATAAVTVLTRPRLARALAQGGRERVLSGFSVRTMVEQTEDLYCDILARKPTRRWPI